MAVVAGDILRVAARMKWNNVDDIVNVLHVEVFTIPTGGAEADLMEDLSEYLTSAYDLIEEFLANDVTSYDISAYNVTQDTPYGSIGWGSGFPGGSGSGEAMPPYVGPLILFPTFVKRRVGRMYIGGILESGNVDGKVHGTLVDALEIFGDELREPGGQTNGSTFRYCVYSRAEGVRSIPTRTQVQPYMAVQRRRKPGRGS